MRLVLNGKAFLFPIRIPPCGLILGECFPFPRRLWPFFAFPTPFSFLVQWLGLCFSPYARASSPQTYVVVLRTALFLFFPPFSPPGRTFQEIGFFFFFFNPPTWFSLAILWRRFLHHRLFTAVLVCSDRSGFNGFLGPSFSVLALTRDRTVSSFFSVSGRGRLISRRGSPPSPEHLFLPCRSGPL